MPIPANEDIAGRLDEVARLLAEQGANRFRVHAYHQAADVLRGLARPVSEIFTEQGLAGWEKLTGVGESIARSIRDILLHGKLAVLERLRGEHDPIALLTSVPGIGKALAWKMHEDLGIETLEELESAANLRVSEIAYEVGFQSLTHFNREFKELVGKSPTACRAQLPKPA